MSRQPGERLIPPAAILEIADALERAGFETWCVGGAVRDALLGQAHLDWDLATAARPQEVRRLFRRTVPIGIEFGTIGVLDADGIMHEVTTFRRDVQTDGRHAIVEFGASLEEDLARRDFTINAIAYSPRRGELRDPFGGRDDLRRGEVRAVGHADERMREDRLRALRAIRFATRFGFRIEPATWAAIVASAPHLTRLSMERVKQELEKTMEQVARPSGALEMWRAAGALDVLVPALARRPPGTFALLDCLPAPGETRRGERRSGRVANRLAALFLGLPPATVRDALKALRFSNAQIAWTSQLAEQWLELLPRLEAAVRDGRRPDDPELRRIAAIAGRTRLASLLRLAAASWTARGTAGSAAPSPALVASLYRRAVRIAYRDPIELGDLAVNGNDLMTAGFAQGPGLRKILLALLERVTVDPACNTRDRLLSIAARMQHEIEERDVTTEEAS